jgi:hypothetical protein
MGAEVRETEGLLVLRVQVALLLHQPLDAVLQHGTAG